MLIADNREPKEIIDMLKSFGVLKEVRTLPFGDYWIESTSDLPPLIIERKTINDMLSSLSKRIFDQIKLAKETDTAEVRIILEGDWYVLKFRQWAEEKVMGLLWSLENEWKVPVTYVKNKKWTAYWLAKWTKQRLGEKEEKKIVPLLNVKKTGDSQRILIEALPGISGILADRLLKHFRKPINIFNATMEQLMEVEGIGEKKAKRIIEVLWGEYSDK